MAALNSQPVGLLAGIVARHRGELGLALAILAVVIVTALVDRSHAYWERPAYNAKEIVRQTSLLGIFALGAATVIIAGGIDLSSGAIIAFSGTVCCSIILVLAPVDEFGNPLTDDLHPAVLAAAIAGTLLAALLIGSFHAWLITVVQLPPFVATLASLVGLRSLARLLIQDITRAFTPSGSSTQIYVYDQNFRRLGDAWWIPVVVFLLLAAAMWVLLARTVVGRHLYALGGNEEAARLSGIRTDRLKWLAYCIGTTTAAIAGILFSGYIGQANPATQGLGYELNAIAAAVVGGCSLTGGVGTVAGTMLGAMFLRVVIDAVAKIMAAKPDEFQGLIVGILVVLAVAFNELRSGSGLKKQFFPGGLGLVNVIVLSLLAAVVAAVTVADDKLATGAAAGLVVLTLLVARKLAEAGADRRARLSRLSGPSHLP